MQQEPTNESLTPASIWSSNLGPVVALFKPQIPPNTGNISRLCVAINSPLVIVGQPAFRLDEASLKRAGLDHWPDLQFSHYPRFKDFYLAKQGRLVAISKEGENSLADFSFLPGDILLFGNETHGLPPRLLKLADERLRIPMFGPVRSLNLSNAVAILAYEYLRQMKSSFSHPWPEKICRRTYYRRPQ